MLPGVASFCYRGLAGVDFPGQWGGVLVLDDDGHAHVGKVLLEGDNVLVKQADAAFAGTTGNRILVIGAAVDADAAVAGCLQAQEPVPVGQNAATAVLEVVMPGGRVLNHCDLEGLAVGRLGGAHVAAALLVALVLAHAARELGHEHGVAIGVAVIYAEVGVSLRDDDKGGASGLSGQWHAGYGGQGVGALLLWLLALVTIVVRACGGGSGNKQQGEDDEEFVKHSQVVI